MAHTTVRVTLWRGCSRCHGIILFQVITYVVLAMCLGQKKEYFNVYHCCYMFITVTTNHRWHHVAKRSAETIETTRYATREQCPTHCPMSSPLNLYLRCCWVRWILETIWTLLLPSTRYTERSGNRTHIVEVSPRVFSQLLQRGKLYIGWTSCHLKENLYVPTCFSTLGHATIRCTEQQPVCNNYAGRHATTACTMDDNTRFVCNECKKWRRPQDHFFAAVMCHSANAWVEWLRLRTDYDYFPVYCGSSLT